MIRPEHTPHDGNSTRAARAVAMLEKAGLRATAQRMMLVSLLFGTKNHRHVSAEQLFEEAILAGSRVSLATVYNTLRALTSAGLLRQVNVDGMRFCSDTNMADHYHIFDESTGELTDIDADTLKLVCLPPLPPGARLQGIDLVVRVRS